MYVFNMHFHTILKALLQSRYKHAYIRLLRLIIVLFKLRIACNLPTFELPDLKEGYAKYFVRNVAFTSKFIILILQR